MFEDIKAYIKDNPEGLWFKRKLYGWGWYPVRWQGWTVIAVFIVYAFLVAFSLDSSPEPTTSDIVWFFAKLIIGVGVLFWICYKKGEKPKWQWGPPKK